MSGDRMDVVLAALADLAGDVRNLTAGQERLAGDVRDLKDGQERLTGEVRALKDGQERLASDMRRLEGDMAMFRANMTSELGSTRAAIMDRIDRMGHAIDLLRDDITVN